MNITTPVIVLSILAIIGALYMIVGYHKGFLRMVVPVVSLIIGIGAAIILSPTVQNILVEKTEIKPWLTDKLAVFIAERLSSGGNFGDLHSILDSLHLPEGVGEILQYLDPSKSSLIAVLSARITDGIAETLAGIILNIGTFIAVGLVFYIIFLIIGFCMIKSKKDDEKKRTDKIFGMLLGLISFAVLVEVVGLVAMLLSMTPFGTPIIEVVRQSKILSFLFDNNVLVEIIKTLLPKLL